MIDRFFRWGYFLPTGRIFISLSTNQYWLTQVYNLEVLHYPHRVLSLDIKMSLLAIFPSQVFQTRKEVPLEDVLRASFSTVENATWMVMFE